MSGRLVASRGGLLRSLQITNAKLVVFIEGKDSDPYFYERVVEPLFARAGDYRIMRSEEVAGVNRGGKGRLKELYGYLRRSGNLMIDFKGVRKPTLFYLDKDIDDLNRTRLRSDHVVYTRAYDVEGEIYRHGDLGEALMASASLLRSEVDHALRASDYRVAAIDSWQTWTEYCVAAALKPELGLVGYGSAVSKIHSGLGTHDPTLASAHQVDFGQACLRVGASDVSRIARAKRAVVADIRVQSGYGLFKGKWFGNAIEALAEADFPGRIRRVSAFPSRLTSHLSQTLDFAGQWADHFRDPAAALLRRV